MKVSPQLSQKKWLLAESKILSYELHGGKLVLVQGQGKKMKKGLSWKRLESALAESFAFKKWLDQASLEEVGTLKL